MKRAWPLWLIVVVGVLLVSGSVRSAYACSIMPPEPWFTEFATLDQPLSLPDGVDVRVVRDGAMLEFRNRSSTELLITGELRGVLWQRDPSAFPRAGQPPRPVLHRIVSSHAFSWDWAAPESPDEPSTKLQWTLDVYDSDSIFAQIGWGAIGTGQALLATYDDHNLRADGRPADVPIPAPEHVALQVVYGADVLAIPLTIEYRLNPAYDPHGQQRYDEAMASCTEAYTQGGTASAANQTADPSPQRRFAYLLPVAGLVTVVAARLAVRRRRVRPR